LYKLPKTVFKTLKSMYEKQHKKADFNFLFECFNLSLHLTFNPADTKIKLNAAFKA